MPSISIGITVKIVQFLHLARQFLPKKLGITGELGCFTAGEKADVNLRRQKMPRLLPLGRMPEAPRDRPAARKEKDDECAGVAWTIGLARKKRSLAAAVAGIRVFGPKA